MASSSGIRVRVTYHETRSLNAALGEKATAYMARLGNDIATSARRRAPHRTGRLAASIGSRVGGRGGSLGVTVYATAPYAKFVHEGHGPITMPRGRFMVWDGPNGPVFARHVRGQPARPFLLDALEAVLGRHAI